MFVRKSAIKQFGCNGKPCTKDRKECIIEPPFDIATRHMLARKLIDNPDFYMPLPNVESAYKFPSGSVKTISLDATLLAISFKFDKDVGPVQMTLGILVSDIHPMREEGDLERVGRIMPGWHNVKHFAHIPLTEMNIDRIIMLLANHEFAFRV